MTDKDRIALLEAEVDRLKECVDEIAQRSDVGAGARLFFQLLTAKSATLTHASPERADEGAYSCGHGIRLTEICPKCHPEREAPEPRCPKCGAQPKCAKLGGSGDGCPGCNGLGPHHSSQERAAPAEPEPAALPRQSAQELEQEGRAIVNSIGLKIWRWRAQVLQAALAEYQAANRQHNDSEAALFEHGDRALASLKQDPPPNAGAVRRSTGERRSM